MGDRLLGPASAHLINHMVSVHLVGQAQEVIEGELEDTTKSALILTSGVVGSFTLRVIPKRQVLYIESIGHIDQLKKAAHA